MDKFTSLDQIKEKDFYIFKHSSSCPISAMAYDVVAAVENSLDLPVYLLIVQDDRASSIEVAQHFGIRHESPQLILVSQGEIIWDASHGSITPTSIRLGLKKLGN